MTDGVIERPEGLLMTVTSPSSNTAMHEKVVPRSMPMHVGGGLGSIFCTAAARRMVTAKLERGAAWIKREREGEQGFPTQSKKDNQLGLHGLKTV